MNDSPIPAKYKDHPLHGNLSGFRDLHIKTDWILLYENLAEEVILVRTGKHSDIFKNIK